MPGEGNITPTLVFIGLSPKQEESLQGKPFLGEPGKLFTKIISAIQLTRKKIYLTYAIKCPLNKNEELNQHITQACRPLLLQELAFLHPKLICTLGPRATQILLETETSFEKLRGKILSIEIKDSPVTVIPTYAPEDLRNSPQKKDLTWLDVQLIRKEYDQIVSQ